MRKSLVLAAAVALASAGALAGEGYGDKKDDAMSQAGSEQYKSGTDTMSDHHKLDGKTRTESFSKLDTDRSGDISKAEAEANYQLTEDWVDVDTNQDGAIDVVEFSRFEPVGEDEMDSDEHSGSQMDQSIEDGSSMEQDQQ